MERGHMVCIDIRDVYKSFFHIFPQSYSVVTKKLAIPSPWYGSLRSANIPMHWSFGEESEESDEEDQKQGLGITIDCLYLYTANFEVANLEPGK